MKLFECQHCGQPLYFENTRCESCGFRLGYLSEQAMVSALEAEGDAWCALAAPKTLYRFCANAPHDVCNWLIAHNSDDALCAAWRHNYIIPICRFPKIYCTGVRSNPPSIDSFMRFCACG